MRTHTLLLLFLIPAFNAAAAPARFVSPESLAAELHQIAEAIQQGNISVTIPDAWEVDTRGRHYVISTQPLRELLMSPDLARRDLAQQWLGHLADKLSYSGALAAPSSLDQRLDRILARREFAPKPPPSVFERLWGSFRAWLTDLLRRIFGPAFGNPSTGRILVWTLGLLAAAFLLYWLRRWYRRREIPVDLRFPTELPSLEASEWLRAARDFAGRGDLRGAIHAAYWAGVTHLQGKRLLPADFTRTPREYLRCVSRGEASYPPLAALTTELERFWYADQPVGHRDFEEALTHLDRLGTR